MKYQNIDKLKNEAPFTHTTKLTKNCSHKGMEDRHGFPPQHQ